MQSISLQLFQTTTVEVLLDVLGIWLLLKQLVSVIYIEYLHMCVHWQNLHESLEGQLIMQSLNFQ